MQRQTNQAIRSRPRDSIENRQFGLGIRWPGTEVSRALRARTPKRVRKESERVSHPGGPQSPQRVRHGVRKESGAAFLDSFRTAWRTLWGLWGSPGRDTLSDSFRTLLGVQARRARETSVPGQGVPKFWGSKVQVFEGQLSGQVPGSRAVGCPASVLRVSESVPHILGTLLDNPKDSQESPRQTV